MSMVKVVTALPKWFGPIFPPDIDSLNKSYAISRFHPPVIRQRFEKCEAFILKDIITADMRFLNDNVLTTDDGYKWLGGLHFEYSWKKKTISRIPGEVMVALPRMNDTKGIDNVPLDRSIAFYIKDMYIKDFIDFVYWLTNGWIDITHELWFVERVRKMDAGGLHKIVVTTDRGPNPSEPAIRSVRRKLSDLLKQEITYLGYGLNNPDWLHFLFFGNGDEIPALKSAGFTNIRIFS